MAHFQLPTIHVLILESLFRGLFENMIRHMNKSYRKEYTHDTHKYFLGNPHNPDFTISSYAQMLSNVEVLYYKLVITFQ